jgi:hypothetical protein
MTRTTKQVLADQQQQATRFHEGGKAKAAASLPATTAAASVPAAIDPRTTHEQYLDDIAPSGVVGRLIKFTKEGKFTYLDDDEEISPEEDFTALIDQTLVSWVRFHDGAPPERRGGLLYQGFRLPPRETLGDVNPAKWPIGLSGNPEDPFKHEVLLVLQRPATMELATFGTTSKTGRRAVGNLLRHYDRLQRTDPGAFPVVRLKASGFQHSDQRIGWVPTPLFVVVGRSPGHTAAIPDTSLAAEMNDQIPF